MNQNFKKFVGSAYDRTTMCIKEISQTELMRNSVFQIYALSILLNITIEAFSRFSIWKALVYMCTSPLIFLTNMLIISILIAPCNLCKRKGFFLLLASVIWLAVGIINFVVLHNRVTPFNSNDFNMLQDAFEVVF